MDYKGKGMDEKARRDAYKEAKERFQRLSPLKKLWFNLIGQGVNSYGPYVDVETLDSLYGGKSR